MARSELSMTFFLVTRLASHQIRNQDWLLQQRGENAVLVEVPENGAIINLPHMAA